MFPDGNLKFRVKFEISSHLWQIPVLADLPVGENLLDHLFIDVDFTVEGDVSLTSRLIHHTWWTKLEHSIFGTGVLTLHGYSRIVQRSLFNPTVCVL